MKLSKIITYIMIYVLPEIVVAQQLSTADFVYDKFTSDTLFNQITRSWFKNGVEVKQQSISLFTGLVLFEKTTNDSNIVTRTTFFADGKLKSTMRMYNNQFRILSIDTWYENNVKKLEVRYTGKEYTVIHRDSVGNLIGCQKWDNALKMTDTTSYFYPSGKLFKRYTFDHGKLLNVVTLDSSGNRIANACLETGNGLFYNYTRESFKPQLSSITTYRGGLADGKEFKLNRQGDTTEMTSYKEGRKDGEYIKYNGKYIVCKGTFADNTMNGLFIYNYNDGKPRYGCSFNDGEISSVRCMKHGLDSLKDKRTIKEFLNQLCVRSLDYDTLINYYFHPSAIMLLQQIPYPKDIYDMFGDMKRILQNSSYRILNHSQSEAGSRFKTNMSPDCDGFFSTEEIYMVTYQKRFFYFLMEDNKIKSVLPYSLDEESTLWYPFDSCDGNNDEEF